VKHVHVQLACAAALILSGCGGGGGSRVAPSPHATSSAGAAPAAVTVRVSVPLATALTAARKRALFVSPSTQGIAVTVTPHGATTPVVLANTFDISAGSALCTPGASSRSCALALALPSGGPYDFAFKTYDAAPVSGSFSTAHALGAGTTPSVTIGAGQTNTIGVNIGGIVASAFVLPAAATLHGTAASAQQVAVGALDADGSLIITSGAETYADANGNAVSIALAVSGAGSALSIAPASIENSLTAVTVTYAPSLATVTQLTNGFPATLTATPSNGAPFANTAVNVVAVLSELANSTSGATLVGICLGPDHNIWIVENNPSNSGAQITPSGTFTNFNLFIGTLTGVSSGPVAPFNNVLPSETDVWYGTTNGIGVVSTDLEDFTVNSATGGISALTEGPDGNVWFTRTAAGLVGRMLGDGSFTNFASPAANPGMIAAGPDGNLWFTVNNNTSYAVMTTAGAVVTIQVSGATYTALAPAPGGQMAFADAALNTIELVNTSSFSTQRFTIPTAASSPAGMAAGPDGNLWFTESATDKIGKMTPGGAFTEYNVSAGAHPTGIVVGADGNLWFLEPGLNKIGRIAP
jgi:hypothetical protein